MRTKYLFIELKVQDGEREHNHRILHTTRAKNINFAAERYAAKFWGEGEREPKDNYWWVNGEITIRVDYVVEITLEQYNLMSTIFSGNKPQETRVYVLSADEDFRTSAYNIAEWKAYENAGEPLPKEAEEFMLLAENNGNVFSLENFMSCANDEGFNLANDWIFITNSY